MITKIVPPRIIVQSPSSSVERYNLNEYEFLALRASIKKNSIDGWSWVQEKEHEDGEDVLHPINKHGRMYTYPPQFQLFEQLLYKLI